MSFLLHRIGYSPQVPAHRAVERNEAAIVGFPGRSRRSLVFSTDLPAWGSDLAGVKIARSGPTGRRWQA